MAENRATEAGGLGQGSSTASPLAAAAQDASVKAVSRQWEGQAELQLSAASPAERGAAVAPGSQQHAAPPQQESALMVPAQSGASFAAGTGTTGCGTLVRLSKDGPFNVQLVKWGLSQEIARDALNPGEPSVG